jgi:predicted RNA-binding Zn-ribbon protein involved in translation (DUF1610 family)
MEINRDLLAPCGLYCGVCGIMIADRDDNQKFKERLCTVYNVGVEEIKCTGCMSDDTESKFLYCRVCPIRECVIARGYEGCHQCDDWPCKAIDDFVMPVGKKVMDRAIPRWREWGTEKYVVEEEKRYHCPSCGGELFRGAKRCRACGEPVDVD